MNGPRWVQIAAVRPHRCALLPSINNQNSGKGFLDWGTDLDREHVYTSVTAVELAAQRLGWVPKEFTVALEEKVAVRDERIAGLEAELAGLRSQMQAVQVLKSAGYSATRKPGRPPKREKVTSG